MIDLEQDCPPECLEASHMSVVQQTINAFFLDRSDNNCARMLKQDEGTHGATSSTAERPGSTAAPGMFPKTMRERRRQGAPNWQASKVRTPASGSWQSATTSEVFHNEADAEAQKTQGRPRLCSC